MGWRLWFKAFLVAVMMFGSSFSLAHASSQEHVLCHETDLCAAATNAGASKGSDGQLIPDIDVQHHHYCGCQGLVAHLARSFMTVAPLDGACVLYSAAPGDGAAKFAPPPLRKPPRLA